VVNNSDVGGEVRRVADTSWSEATVTSANAPAGDAAVLGRLPNPVGLNSWQSVDVTPLVTGDGVVSVRINSSSADGAGYASKEWGGGLAPQLVVTTEPAPGDPVVAAAGDISCDPANASYNGGSGTSKACRQLAVSNLLMGTGLAAVLPLGDNQYENGELANYQQAFDPSWGRAMSIMRPIAGNHEYKTAGAAGYFDYFNGVGVQSGRAGDRGAGYYSYDIGAWHMIALNSNCTVVGCGSGSAQEQWLRSDLAAHSNTCTLAYWHHPRWSSGGVGDSPAVGQLYQDLYNGGAEVLLTGHNRAYERFGPQEPNAIADPSYGIRQFVVGTGGRDLYGFNIPLAANEEIRNASSFGVLRLTLHSSGYSWRFAAEGAGTLADAGSASCHGAPQDNTPPSAPANLAGSSPSSTQISLNWSASSDNTRVAGYRIYRNGTEIGTTKTTSYTDSGRSAGTTYSYTVKAFDSVGNTSAASNTATATTASSTRTFTATADTYVQQDLASSNFGAENSLYSDASPVKNILLKFNVSGIGTQRVTSARLRLYVVNASDVGGEVRRVADTSWSEASVTWANAPAGDTLLGRLPNPVGLNSWQSVYVTPLVTGDGVVSVRISSTSADGAGYASKEWGGGLAPQLVVGAS
jgi:acid phosphatase type 7